MKTITFETRVYEYDEHKGKLGAGAFAEVFKGK